ncbi:MAG: TIR domain-containing protein, partial [Rhizobiaceae bacterium]
MQVFISYSSKNQVSADRVNEWLLSAGITSVFMSAGLENGIREGEEWEKRLYAELKTCRVFLPLVSPDWIASSWCNSELRIAKMLGKAFFPVLVAHCDHQGIDAQLQSIDIALDSAERLEDARLRLVRGVEERLRRRGRRLQATEHVFPGMRGFDEGFAPAFFGREDETGAVIEKIEELRRDRSRRTRVLLVTGASGVGKSSLLRAGVIPEIRSRATGKPAHNGIGIVGPIRPLDGLDSGGSESFLSALAVLLASSGPDGGGRSAARAVLSGALPFRALVDALPPELGALLVCVDQAEELLRPECGGLLAFLETLSASSDLDAVLLMAVRGDMAIDLQARFDAEVFPLRPLDREGMREAIVEPFHLAAYRYEVALVDSILDDARGGADAMPLVAQMLATLERDGKDFTVKRYRELGGLDGLIGRGLEDSYALAATDEGREAVRRVFVPGMAHVDADGYVTLGRIDLENVPAAAHAVIDDLVDRKRLLRRVENAGTASIEPAHQALLRNWSRLSGPGGWIEQESAGLRAIDQVIRATAEWIAGRNESLLLHRGERLAEAEKRVADPASPFRRKAGDSGIAYLAACRAHIDAEDAEKKKADDDIVRGLGLILAGEVDAALTRGAHLTACRLALAGFVTTRRKGISAPLIDGGLVAAAARNDHLVTFRGHSSGVTGCVFSPDGRSVLTGSRDNTARLWEAATGK